MTEFPHVSPYETDFQPGADGSQLVVILSNNRDFSMPSRDFGRDVLRIASHRSAFFTRNPNRLAQAIRRFGRQYETILFQGGSKGGFGALLLAGLCAEADPKRTYYALAMSPQVRLYPADLSLPFPTYHRLLRQAERNPEIMKGLTTYGDTTRFAHLPNFHATVVYGVRNPVDVRQAGLIEGPNVRKIEIQTGLHSTILFFGPRPVDEARLRQRFEYVYSRPMDDDLAATRPDMNEAISDILNSQGLPTMEGMMDDAVAGGSVAA